MFDELQLVWLLLCAPILRLMNAPAHPLNGRILPCGELESVLALVRAQWWHVEKHPGIYHPCARCSFWALSDMHAYTKFALNNSDARVGR